MGVVRHVSRLLREFFAKNRLYVLRLSLWAEDELLLPPFTSSLVKSVAMSSESLEWVAEAYRESLRPRRARFSVLWMEGKPLYKRHEGGGGLRMLRGRGYRASITVVGNRSLDPLLPLSAAGEERVETPYGALRLRVDEVLMMGGEEEAAPPAPGRDFALKLDFHTPVILTQKLLTPPWIGLRRRGIPERHRLLPTPGLLGASMVSYILGVMGHRVEPFLSLPYYFARVADLALYEVNYKLLPTTAVFGRGDEGRLRKPRGFTGWVEYGCAGRGPCGVFYRLMRLAAFVGVGRSRSSGFGETRVCVRRGSSVRECVGGVA